MDNSYSLHAWGITVLRVVVGIVFLMHGGQKLFIYGFQGVTAMMGSMGVPLAGVFGIVIPLVEFVGGAALVLGVMTRGAAFLLACDMAGAILFVHLKNGFFLPAGCEFALSLLAANICLALSGAGLVSIDGALGK